MDGIYLLLGSNLGNCQKNLIAAQALIRKKIGPVKKASSIYKTDPWGVADQNWYLNQALEVETGLTPLELLAEIHQIEALMGRVRHQKWEAREIDIDILYYRNLVVQEVSLTIPHPEIPSRRFTLVPMAEIGPEEIHPIKNKTQAQLLVECPDKLGVKKYRSKLVV